MVDDLDRPIVELDCGLAARHELPRFPAVAVVAQLLPEPVDDPLAQDPAGVAREREIRASRVVPAFELDDDERER
jgi:hypothetical protein